MSEVELITYRGSGPGGQHRNTSDTAVRARHLPTGIEAKSEAQRSWNQNRLAALAELERRVADVRRSAAKEASNDSRVAQVGLGDRVSHDWTWNAWRDTVTCRRSGRSWSMSSALRGRFM